MDKNNKKQLTLDEIMKEISEDVEKQINIEEEKQKSVLDDVGKQKIGFMKKIYIALLTRLCGKLKVKVTLYWNDKVIYEFEIPKN